MPDRGMGERLSIGNTWIGIAGLPAGAIVEADRTNPSKFYTWSGNPFYISTERLNAQTVCNNQPSRRSPLAARRFKAVYGYDGDIWLAGGSDTTA